MTALQFSTRAESAAHPERTAAPRRRLRVTHVVSSLKVGGMEQFVLRLGRTQQEDGHAVSVLSLRDGDLVEEAGDLKLKVLRHGSILTRVPDAALWLRRMRPDVVHAHNPTSLQYAVLARVLTGARVVMTDHGQCAGVARETPEREWKRTDAVVAVSADVLRRRGLPECVRRQRVIRNGVQFAAAQRERAEVRAELGLAGRTVGIMTARLEPVKGHDVLLRALSLLQGDAHPWTVLVVGDGRERAKLEELAASLGLGPDRLRFLGFRNDVPDLLAASDFFILPSRQEGLPLAMLEAMQHRLPVIATPVGGIPEVVSHSHEGFLVPVDDPRSVATAVRQLLEAPDLARSMGEAGARIVNESFTFRSMADQYEALYHELLP
jgi:L-malate glycosyltransferase